MAIRFNLHCVFHSTRGTMLSAYVAWLSAVVRVTRDHSFLRAALLEASRILYGVMQYILTRFGNHFKLLMTPSEEHEEPFPEWQYRLKMFVYEWTGQKNAALACRISAAEALYKIGGSERATELARECYDLYPTAANRDRVLRYLLVHGGDTQKEFFEESGRNEKNSDGTAQKFSINRDPERVLHIGILSDFLGSVIGRFTLYPQIKYADANRVRYFIYDFGKPHTFGAFFTDDYRHVDGLSSQELFGLIRKDRIDILIETNGRLRPQNRYDVLALRAAPLQLNWYNLAATAGSHYIDYSLVDDVAVPAGQEAFFYERLYRLPLGAVGGWHLPQVDDVAPLPADTNGFITFGCFGDMFKLNAGVLSAWAEILRHVPTARLYIKNWNVYRPAVRARLYHFFAMCGVAPERLIFDICSSLRVMNILYGHVDIALDTFPYSGGSTTMNALWQGVPVLTFAGKDWRGRTTASIMASAGLTEFVVTNVDDYIERAVQLAGRCDDLRQWRQTMRERLLARSAYYRIEDFNADFETAMRVMWKDWLQQA